MTDSSDKELREEKFNFKLHDILEEVLCIPDSQLIDGDSEDLQPFVDRILALLTAENNKLLDKLEKEVDSKRWKTTDNVYTENRRQRDMALSEVKQLIQNLRLDTSASRSISTDLSEKDKKEL